ncbi:MAG: peroxide stress protein YaaA [Candidatus Woesearchaeota archaeon]
MNTLFLLPPSEGKHAGGDQKPLEHIKNETAQVIQKIQTQKDLEKLYGVKTDFAQKAHALNLSIQTQQTLPAIKRYAGVVYKALDYESLDKSAQTFFHIYFRIVSPLFGLVKPNQLLPEYKLKFQKLSLQTYWQPFFQKQLKSFFVIDLLAQEQRKAVAYDTGIKIDFCLKKNGKSTPAGHNGKYIKGRFIRYVVQHEYTKPEDFLTFTEDGFIGRLLCDTHLVFEKEM